MLKGWFAEVRLRKELTLIRRALERIANNMERGSGSPAGLTSYYKGSGPEEGTDVQYMDDDLLAHLEAIDQAAARTGVEPMSEFDGDRTGKP